MRQWGQRKLRRKLHRRETHRERVQKRVRQRVQERARGTWTGDVGREARGGCLTLRSSSVARWSAAGRQWVLWNWELVEKGLLVIRITLLDLLRVPEGEVVGWNACVRHACCGDGFGLVRLCKLAWCFLDCCAGFVTVEERGVRQQEVAGKVNVKFVCFYIQWVEVVCRWWSPVRRKLRVNHGNEFITLSTF